MWPILDVGVQLHLLPLAVLTQGPFRSALSMGCRSAALRTSPTSANWSGPGGRC
jgi:hypothetical protein